MTELDESEIDYDYWKRAREKKSIPLTTDQTTEADITSSISIKASNLRKNTKYPSLKEWINDKQNLYVGRSGRIWIRDKKGDDTMKIYHYRGSKFGNPYRVSKKLTLSVALKSYIDHLVKTGLIGEIDELKGKTLGCFCEKHVDSNGKIMCHARILSELANGKKIEEIITKIM